MNKVLIMSTTGSFTFQANKYDGLQLLTYCWGCLSPIGPLPTLARVKRKCVCKFSNRKLNLIEGTVGCPI